MVNRPKQIGTAAETAVLKAARSLGFPSADRHVLKGRADEGDIWLLSTGGTLQVVIEVKGGQAAERASDAQILAWLDETDAEVLNAPKTIPGSLGATTTWVIGLLVTKRKGIGAANAHRWWAHMRLSTLNNIQATHVEGRYTDNIVLRTTLGEALRILFEEDWR